MIRTRASQVTHRGSVIIHDFADKSSFFMSLGASRLTKRIVALLVGLWACLGFISCGGSSTKAHPSGLTERIVASQSVSAPTIAGGLYLINGVNDTIGRAAPLSSGGSPGVMAISPTRNIIAAFDASTTTVFAIDTVRETSIGNVRIFGPTSSMVIPLASPIVYAAVPTAVITGFALQGAVEFMNFSTGTLITIAAPGAQTVVSNANGTQLLVFSNDSDSVTVLNPGVAVPPVDTSCYSNPPNSVCTIVPGFDRPVFALISGNTAYVLNCGPQCGGTQASVAVFDLSTLTITGTIPVDGATMAIFSGSTLLVAGTPTTAANNACTGQTTAATTCGRLDFVDLSSGTVTGSAVITDGFHDRMELTSNGQLFIGARDCTNIGDVNNPSGEVRGCLSIYKIADGSVLIPPENGNVNGLQALSTRNVAYVASGGALRVYDTTKDALLINDFLPEGIINIPGYIGDVKAIDFF
jgi:hypothetical protein